MTDRENEPGVFISLKDVYDELKVLTSDIRTLVAKMDTASKVDDDHEQRLRTLERWKYAIPVTALTTLVMFTVEVLRLTGKS